MSIAGLLASPQDAYRLDEEIRELDARWGGLDRHPLPAQVDSFVKQLRTAAGS